MYVISGLCVMNKPYQLVNCDFHDVLEVAAMQRRQVVLVYQLPDGQQTQINTQIADVFAQAGADYLRLIDGATIRLDQLISIDGLRLDGFTKTD